MPILKSRLWLTEDRSAAVPDGDPKAVHLLGGEGQTVDGAEVERLGLTDEHVGPDEPTLTTETAVKAETEPPATKAETKPAAKKAAPAKAPARKK